MNKYNITGMSCAACQNRVEKAVSKVAGVDSVSVSLLTNSMQVEGNANEDVYKRQVYVGTRNIGYIFVGFTGLSVASVAAYKIFYHVQERVFAWQNPWSDPADTGYQITQSLFAIRCV